MKRLVGWMMALLLLGLVGCASQSFTDNYAKYRGDSSTQLFTNAQAALSKKHYADAVELLEAMDAIYPFGPQAQQAQLDIIYAYYQDSDTVSAAAAAERYIRLYPRGKHADYAYYMKGLIEYQQGLNWLQKKFKINQAKGNLDEKKSSFVAFKTLIELYPSSPYAKDAQLHMVFMRNLFAEQQLLIAQYYLKRQAYVAAVNRATEVVEHYDQTPSVASALVVLVQAYRELGLNQQAENTLKILAASYPKTPELKSLQSPTAA